MNRRSDGGQHPVRGRLLRGLVALGLTTALLAGSTAPTGGIRSTAAAATTAHAAPVSTAAFELVSPTTKRPLQWPACRPIAYAINPAGMPKGMDAVIKRVMAGVQQQTGARFRYAGSTKRTFGAQSRPTVPTIVFAFTGKTKAYGHRFAYPGEIGMGGPVGAWYMSGDGRRYEAITSGRVLLSTAFAGKRTGAGATWQSLIRHEVGHALNLAHRSSRTAVMNPMLTSKAPSRFTSTEVAALKRVLQRKGCDYAAWSRL
ncbi:matrixin family metalloprotease [Amnibacterium endophyticum]|uniref:Matrixin family metalloprotease n=1 Tax=Amnibacterium endophyticum TaxID=2109337 RepID=A0ABW4L9P5_9MICO